MERKAKIGATLGPACDHERVLRGLLRAGMDVARLNFSHGDAAEHRERVARLRRLADCAGRTVADLQGPRFRVGELPGGEVELETGADVTLEAGRTRASRVDNVPVSYAALARDVRAGEHHRGQHTTADPDLDEVDFCITADAKLCL